MVSYHNHRAHSVIELLAQPGYGGPVQANRVAGKEPPILRAHPNGPVVYHDVSNRVHDPSAAAAQLKVGPQGAAEEPDAPQIDGSILKEVDAQLRRPLPELIRELGQSLAVIFVVTCYVECWDTREPRGSPL